MSFGAVEISLSRRDLRLGNGLGSLGGLKLPLGGGLLPEGHLQSGLRRPHCRLRLGNLFGARPGFGLSQLRLRRLQARLRLIHGRLGLPSLNNQHRLIQLDQHLAGQDLLAFIGQHLDNTPTHLGGYAHFLSLDSAGGKQFSGFARRAFYRTRHSAAGGFALHLGHEIIPGLRVAAKV